MAALDFNIFTKYPSHAVGYGASGTGKSVNTKFCAELFYEEGYKIIDIYDEGRFENCFYFFSNEDTWMFDLRKKRTGNSKEKWTPRGYPTECYIPVCPTIPKKLPALFKPFKIAFGDLKVSELIILLGNLSSSQKAVIALAWDQINKKNSFEDFIDVIRDLISNTKIKIDSKIMDVCDNRTGITILQRLNNLNQLGIISHKKDPLALDLNKIMKDKDTITCFSFAFLEDQNIRHLLWGYLFRKIYTLRLKYQYYQYPPLVIVHREIQNNAPARGKKSSLSYEGQALSLEFIKKIIAEPRDVGIRLFADSQDPLKIDSDVRKGFTTRFIFRMDWAIVTSLTNQFWLDPKTIRGIQSQPMGVWTLKGVPEAHNPMNRYGIQHKCTFPPPRSLCKKPNDLLFKIWAAKKLPFNKWNFKKPKTLITIKKLSQEEIAGVENFKERSIYDYYFSLIELVVGDNPGLSIRELADDPIIKKMPWGDYTSVNRIVDKMCQETKLLRTKRDGRTWALNLPKPEPVTPIT